MKFKSKIYLLDPIYGNCTSIRQFMITSHKKKIYDGSFIYDTDLVID